MILFDCPNCARGLRVKPELTGKKVKCPKCGQVVLVPAEMPSPVPAGNSAAGGNLPDEKTRAPSEPNAVEAPTMPPADARTVAPAPREDTNPAPQPDVTQDLRSEEDRSLTEFLAPPQQPDEIGRLGGYRVLKVLGAGGMGVVFKAEDPSLERLVAIKAMLPDIAASASAKKRFLREAKAAAAIKHNHIVTIHQVGEDRGIPFLAMEFLKGEPLDEKLKREKTLPLMETLRIGREMAEGLAAAHEEGLIHRDIKPANTWLEARGEGRGGRGEKSPSAAPLGSLAPRPASLAPSVKILDFGLARAETDKAHLTQSGAIIGTPAYMSPEQGRGEKLDARSDLWSLGVVLYRMCTGVAPFKGTDTLTTLMSVVTDNPPPPAQICSDVPAGLSDLVMKLLEKDPANRIATAHEVVEALRGLEQSQQATQVMASPQRKQVTSLASAAGSKTVNIRRKSRLPLVLALAGGLAALIVAGVVFFWPTPDGVIRVEINDPKIEVAFAQGELTFKGKDKQLIKVSPGKKVGLHVKRGDFEFDTDKFILRKGETITLRVEWFEEGKLQVLQDGKLVREEKLPKTDIVVAPPARGEHALYFDGKSYVDIPSLKRDDLGPYTIETWARVRALPEGQMLVRAGGNASLQVSTIGKQFQAAEDLSVVRWVHAGPVTLDQWTHIAAVADGTSITLYVDGRKKGADAQTASAIKDSKIVSTMGCDNGWRFFFTGMLGETRISKVARYQAEFTPAKRFEVDAATLALYHFDAGEGTVLQDCSGHGHHGRIVGAKWVKANGPPITPPLPDPRPDSIVQKFLGHTRDVYGVAVSRDGQRVLTGSRDNTAALWDAASGKKMQTFEGHTQAVGGVALSSDGKHVLTGSQDKTAILWDAASGKKIQTFEGHADTIRSVALSDDSQYVVTGSFDNTAILWEAASGKKLQTFQGHTDKVYQVALSRDGKLALTGSADKTAILWDAASGKKVQTFQGQFGVMGAALSDNGKHVLTGQADKIAILWDVASGKTIQTFQGHAAQVWCVALSGDGRHVLTGSDDKTAVLWDSASGKKLQTFQGHAAGVVGVAMSRDGRHALTGSIDATAILWAVKVAPPPESDSIVQKFHGHDYVIWSVVMSGDGKHVLTGSGDHTAILWNAASGQKLQTFRGHGNAVSGVALTADGKQVLTGSWDRTASLWDTASGAKLQTFQGHHTKAIQCAALSGDGKLVLTGSDDGTAILWEAPSGNRIQTFRHADSVQSVALSADGKHVLTGSKDKTAILWEAASGKKFQTYAGHADAVQGVALSPGGKLVLTGSKDNTAILWDAASGKQIRIFEGHADVVRSVALSRDGTRALTGSFDKTAILWDVASGKKLQVFHGHTEGIRSVFLSGDGKHVLTGAHDKAAILWAVKTAPPLPEPGPDSIVQKFLGHTDKVWTVALSDDAKRAVTGSHDNTAILWDVASGKKLQTFEGHAGWVLEAAISGDGKRIATASTDRTATLWDAADGKKLQSLQHADAVGGVALDAAGKFVLTGANDGTAILWDAANGKKIQTLAGHTDAINSVALSGDGKYALTGSRDKTAILWDAASGKKLQTFEGHTAWVWIVALSRDGQRVLTGSMDKTAILWNVASGKRIHTFLDHTEPVTGVAFSGDRKLLLTASRDKTAILWDAASGKKIQTFVGHAEQINEAVLSADGKLVLTGSSNRTAILWAVKAPLPSVLGNKFINNLGMEFALVPRGKSWLGGGNGREGTNEVNISQDFYLGAHEVTQEQWRAVMGKNPSAFSRGGKSADAVKHINDDELKSFPVENVSWGEAQAFVKKLNELARKNGEPGASATGVEAGWEYRLPTEEQWEYACRGGPMADKAESAFDFYFEKPSRTISKDQANFAMSGLNRPRKVGSYPPNQLGLHDMLGNVSEWCEDNYDPKSGAARVIRGGSWWNDANICVATFRFAWAPSDRISHLGLRLARVPVGKESKTADSDK